MSNSLTVQSRKGLITCATLLLVVFLITVWLGSFVAYPSKPMYGTITIPPTGKPSQELFISNKFRMECFDTEPWPIVVLRKKSGEVVWAITLRDIDPATSGARRIRFNGSIWLLKETRVKGTIDYDDVGYGKVEAPTVWIINSSGELENFTIGS